MPLLPRLLYCVVEGCRPLLDLAFVVVRFQRSFVLCRLCWLIILLARYILLPRTLVLLFQLFELSVCVSSLLLQRLDLGIVDYLWRKVEIVDDSLQDNTGDLQYSMSLFQSQTDSRS